MAGLILAILAVWPFVTPQPTAPPVQTPGSNITLNGCHAALYGPPLRIDYVNTAKVMATDVDFTIVDAAGVVESVHDHGKFEPGQGINHVFTLPQDVSPLGLGSARCVVTRVVYADGTSWVNPNDKAP